LIEAEPFSINFTFARLVGGNNRIECRDGWVDSWEFRYVGSTLIWFGITRPHRLRLMISVIDIVFLTIFPGSHGCVYDPMAVFS
jgi:hypothetical protein